MISPETLPAWVQAATSVVAIAVAVGFGLFEHRRARKLLERDERRKEEEGIKAEQERKRRCSVIAILILPTFRDIENKMSGYSDPYAELVALLASHCGGNRRFGLSDDTDDKNAVKELLEEFPEIVFPDDWRIWFRDFWVFESELLNKIVRTLSLVNYWEETSKSFISASKDGLFYEKVADARSLTNHIAKFREDLYNAASDVVEGLEEVALTESEAP